MKRISIILVMLISITISANAELINIKVSAEAIIKSGDIVKARSDAFDDIIKHTLQKSLENISNTNEINTSIESVESKLAPRAKGYIKSIDIVDESISKDTPDNYKITANVTVMMNNLRKDLDNLGLLVQREGVTRIIVFVQEKNIDNVHWHFQTRKHNTAETIVRDIFHSGNFELVDQTQFLQEITPDEERNLNSENIITALNFGARYGADIIITGKSISRTSRVNNSNGESAILASVNLEARQVKNNQLIGKGSGSFELTNVDKQIGGDEAISKATAIAASNLIVNLTSSSAQNIITGIKITLIVNGLKYIEDLLIFQNEFKQIVGDVKSLERRTFSGGMAAYDLVSGSDGIAIASNLTEKGLNSFQVGVRTKSQNSLELILKPN